MKKSLIIGVIVAVVLLIIIVGGYFYYNNYNVCSVQNHNVCHKGCKTDTDCKFICGCGAINKNEKCQYFGVAVDCMPGWYAKCVNNKCEVENINESCVKEGGTITLGGTAEHSFGPNCCNGLSSSFGELINGSCSYKNPDIRICTHCGDGICGLGENKCNCAMDCHEQNNNCTKSSECKLDTLSCKCININENYTVFPPNAGAPAPCYTDECLCRNNKCEGLKPLLK
jgi:hypothetical protein